MAKKSLEPPAPPRPFIGRRGELDRLEREAYGRGFRYAGEPLVIVGEAGIGKTALVAEFLTQFAGRERPYWIQAEHAEDDGNEFESAIRGIDVDRSFRDCIVVIDGADETDEEVLLKLFRRVVNFKRVRSVIITSRKELHLRGERALRLERLSATDAESLLKMNPTVAGLDELATSKLLSTLNGHPLAISLVSGMAGSLTTEKLWRILNGNLYDIREMTSAEGSGILSAAKPIIVSANEAMVHALKKRPDDVFSLTPRKFEELIAELLEDMGYEVTLTKATRDGGKDILASIKTECGDFLCLVEAKKYRADRKVGVSLVRTLYGTLCDYQANSAMLVTTSTYSKDAHALREKHKYQLSLRDYTDVAGWIQRYGTIEARKTK